MTCYSKKYRNENFSKTFQTAASSCLHYRDLTITAVVTVFTAILKPNLNDVKRNCVYNFG